jgi:sulfite exporter TauE/SafE
LLSLHRLTYDLDLRVLVSLLALGFLMGVRHALEADHVAAVASLATRSRSARDSVKLAALWGCGHALMLIACAGLLAAVGATLPPSVTQGLEALAGVVLVALGVDVLRRWRSKRVHFHVHEHGDGVRHLHAHAHQGETGTHDPSRHVHAHLAGVPLRALVVGSVHGLAGSGALVVLALQAAATAAHALLYVILFGLGTILGMTLFSLAIALPMRWQTRHLTWASRGLELTVGMVSVVLGLRIAVQAIL